MTVREFARWKAYYQQAPFDDRHRYYRPAALVAQSMGGAKIGQSLDWLQNDLATREAADRVAAGGFSEADLRTFAALGVQPPQGMIG